MNKLFTEIDNLGLNGVELLALVTGTSYDVVFYANVEGKMVQSNSLAGEGKIEMNHLADFYARVAEIIREDSAYDASALNVVKVDAQKNCSIDKEPINSRVYEIKKNWRLKVLSGS